MSCEILLQAIRRSFVGSSGWILGKCSQSGDELAQAAQGDVGSLCLEVFQNHGCVALRDVVCGDGLMAGLGDLSGSFPTFIVINRSRTHLLTHSCCWRYHGGVYAAWS